MNTKKQQRPEKEQQRILVVDDDADMRTFCQTLLESVGFEVVAADGYDEAIARMDNSIQLALLDVVLTEKSGLDVLKHIRQHYPACPAIMISAFASKENAIAALHEGAADYIEKPVDAHELILRVRHWTTYHAMQFENKRLQDYKAMYEALQQSEEQLRNVIRGASLGYWDWDFKTGSYQVNDRWLDMLGLTRSDITNHISDWESRVCPDDKQGVMNVIEASCNSGESYIVEFRMAHKKGHWVWIQDSGTVISYDPVTHKPLQVCGTHQDISERKNMEDQLLQAQKMEAIGTLVGGIAHDFNNTLAAIQGNIYMSRMELENQQAVSHNLDNIQALSDNAADVVKQLLSFARKGRVEMGTFSLNSFLKEAYKLAKATIPENIELTFTPCEEELLIHGDAPQLQQMLMNLLNNARDALAHTEHPAVSCRLNVFTADNDFIQKHQKISAGQRFACLLIHDNGSGIETDILDKVFEPFFTTKGVDEGTGLGLAMVYGAVQSHGGVIEAKSEPDAGTSFYLYLPLNEGIETLTKNKSAFLPGHGETILLVDDEGSILTTITRVLETLNYHVLSAVDGDSALELFRAHQHNIDLIFTDIIMPKMGGISLARAIRKIDEHVPVIFATGYNKDQVIPPDNKIHHSTVISKPFSLEKVSHLLREMLDQAPAPSEPLV
ncbi:MAG: response regulator [Mariprofundus sp.]